MNENINIVDILKDVPKGTKLWSPICGECEFIEILPFCIGKIQVKHTEGDTYHYYNFTSQGKFSNSSEAECLLFPSKDNRDWTTFKASWRHKHFEPFQKILVQSIGFNVRVWMADIYSHYRGETHYTITGMGCSDNEILPYEGNEDKLGKVIE